MEMKDVIGEIKLELTGNVLELDVDDATLEQIVYKAIREIQRYIDSTQLITVPFARCIDLSGFNVSSVSRVFRVNAVGTLSGISSGSGIDPFYAQQLLLWTNGANMYNLNSWALNYGAWNTIGQIRNTISTDLALKFDKQGDMLYINCQDEPYEITIEYVPKFLEPQHIKSDYWIDIMVRLSVALTKQIEGRIRTKYQQANGLWALDGEQMLAEGNAELDALREQLRVNSQLTYVYD